MDNRLRLCAELVEGVCVCDVGTDHGYLPCFLIKEGRCESALACDIGEKPLASAEEHIRTQGLTDRIRTVLSDGLDSVPMEGVTDVVLAGMGGELIADILGRCVKVRDGSVNIVMQPMSKPEYLRRWLWDNGFAVKREEACISGRFAYTVMSGRFSGERTYRCDDEYLYFGLVKPDTAEAKEYILRQCGRLERAARGMLGSEDKKDLGERLLDITTQKRKGVSSCQR